MNNRTRIALGALSLTTTILLYWRFAARRQSLPCPPWLSWSLENPFVNSVAGAEKILDNIGLKPGMKVLDVGCGPGRLTIPAAERVGETGEVVALDIQAGMLQRVRQKVDAANLTNVRLLQGAAGAGHVECDQFDRALLVTVLGEIPDQKAALTEIFHALKPGGILSVTEVLPDPHYQTRGTVRRLAGEVGFEELSSLGNFPMFTLNLVKRYVERTTPLYHLNVL